MPKILKNILTFIAITIGIVIFITGILYELGLTPKGGIWILGAIASLITEIFFELASTKSETDKPEEQKEVKNNKKEYKEPWED